jgi:hypothetical protein
LPTTPTIYKTFEVVLQDARLSNPGFDAVQFEFKNPSDTSDVVTTTLTTDVQRISNLLTGSTVAQKFIFTSMPTPNGVDTVFGSENAHVTYDCNFISGNFYKLHLASKKDTLISPKEVTDSVKMRAVPEVTGDIKQNYKHFSYIDSRYRGDLVLLFKNVSINGNYKDVTYVNTKVKDGAALTTGGMDANAIIDTDTEDVDSTGIPSYATTRSSYNITRNHGALSHNNLNGNSDFWEDSEHVLTTKINFYYPDDSTLTHVTHEFPFKPMYKSIEVLNIEVVRDDDAITDNGTVTETSGNVINFFQLKDLKVRATFSPVTDYTIPVRHALITLMNDKTGAETHKITDQRALIELVDPANQDGNREAEATFSVNDKNVPTGSSQSNQQKEKQRYTWYKYLGRNFKVIVTVITPGSVDTVYTDPLAHNGYDLRGDQGTTSFPTSLLKEFGEGLKITTVGTPAIPKIEYVRCGVEVTDVFFYRRQHQKHYKNTGNSNDYVNNFTVGGANGVDTVDIPDDFTTKSSINSSNKETRIFIVYKSKFSGNKGFKELVYTPS